MFLLRLASEINENIWKNVCRRAGVFIAGPAAHVFPKPFVTAQQCGAYPPLALESREIKDVLAELADAARRPQGAGRVC